VKAVVTARVPQRPGRGPDCPGCAAGRGGRGDSGRPPGPYASGLTFAYDAMYGVGSEYMARLRPKVFLHGERDPLFGGVTPEPTEDGLGLLIKAMKESGGLSIGGHIPENDGVLACLLLAQIRAERCLLSRTLARIYEQYGHAHSRRVDVHLHTGERALLRFSGTEPLVRVYGEAQTEDALEAVLEDALMEVHRT